MRSAALLAITLAFAAAAGPALATDVTWGPGPVTIGGTSDPAMALIAMDAQTQVTWVGGGPFYSRQAPSNSSLYGFHASDAPAVVDPARLGATVRTFDVPVGPGFQTVELEYDLNGDGWFLPDERTYRVAVESSFVDPTYGTTNAVLAVDIQRPAEVWIDEVDVFQAATTAAELGFVDLGFESGASTSFGGWIPGNDLEPPHPIRDTRTPYAGAAHALLPISNEVASGDRPWIQQTTTGIPDKTLEKDEVLHVSFWGRAPEDATCGAHLRTWDQINLKDDLEASAGITSTWTHVDLLFTISEKSDDIELTLFCTRPATFSDPASSDFRVIMVGP